ncbi:MAG: glutathione peroxidase [Candidatus Dormibacteria bacterium]
MASGIHAIEAARLDGSSERLDAYQGRLALVVNVASQCGLTPQYQGLEALYRAYRNRGLVILGFPCNQFGGQEPGSAEDIATFCDRNYGVTFPLFARIDVNGPNRHPLYERLTTIPDNEGRGGDVLWNFEKFVVSAEGAIIGRFDPRVTPDDLRLVECIEANLPVTVTPTVN